MFSLSSERRIRHKLSTILPLQWMPEACNWPYSSFAVSLGLMNCKDSNLMSVDKHVEASAMLMLLSLQVLLLTRSLATQMDRVSGSVLVHTV